MLTRRQARHLRRLSSSASRGVRPSCLRWCRSCSLPASRSWTAASRCASWAALHHASIVSLEVPTTPPRSLVVVLPTVTSIPPIYPFSHCLIVLDSCLQAQQAMHASLMFLPEEKRTALT